VNKNNQPKCYWIYMLECDNGSFYTGYTINLARRFRQHTDGTANVRYTRSHPPVRIAQCWRLYDTIGTALKLEVWIKRKSRAEKERLVATPAVLAEAAAKAFERRLRIYTVDPAQIQRRSRRMSKEQLKNGFDPFADLPAANL
jgi:putative endonuclease